MESGGRSSNTQQEETMRAPKSGIVIHEADATTNIPVDGSTNPNPQQIFRRNSDQYMPIANVIRIMRRILPPHAKIADDAKETIQECVTEFISFITNEANEKCHREYRKTITPEDILSAMRTLGFDNYVEPLTVFLNKYRAQEYPERSAMHHMLFLRRGAGVVQHPAGQVANPAPLPPPPTTIGFAPPPLPAPPAIMGRAPPLPPPIYSVDGGDFVELPPRIGDYTMGNQGGGEGTSTRMEFDPYRQFK